MNTKLTAKDFFLQLGSIVTFYASAIALITLLFEVINFAYPQITNYYQYYFPSISFQVATLLVAFPLFIFLSWVMQKRYASEPELRESAFRKWLAYITLFIAGGVVAGDLISVIYMFLDGQELTTGFLLKVAVLFVIALGIFMYYLREIRNVISASERNVWRVAAVLIILLSIFLGFTVIGSPRDQRERRYDNVRSSDLQNIQWQILNYWQQKEELPAALSDLTDPLSGFVVPTDPATNAPYEYERKGQLGFNLCATFSQPSMGGEPSSVYPTEYLPEASAKYPETWSHSAGRVCFDRTIDPELYPVRSR